MKVSTRTEYERRIVMVVGSNGAGTATPWRRNAEGAVRCVGSECAAIRRVVEGGVCGGGGRFGIGLGEGAGITQPDSAAPGRGCVGIAFVGGCFGGAVRESEVLVELCSRLSE